MTVDTMLSIAQLVAIIVLLPATGFKIWRKLDERLSQQDLKLNKIEYALFNDGRGMEQQLKEVHKTQQLLVTDMAVIKAVNSK